MTNRIEQIIKEHGFIPDGDLYSLGEIIVEEAVRLVRAEANHWGTLSDDATNHFINKAADKLEEHFK